MEEHLNLDELFALTKAIRDKEHEEFKRLAALQGADVGGEEDMVDIMEIDVGRGNEENDVIDLSGATAQKVGFGIGMGLGYEEQ